MELTREDEINNLNLKVMQREPSLTNIKKILMTVKFGVLAKYNLGGNFWNYQKIKGPMFLVADEYDQKKIVILNQCSCENYIFKVKLFLYRLN